MRLKNGKVLISLMPLAPAVTPHLFLPSITTGGASLLPNMIRMSTASPASDMGLSSSGF